MEDYMTRHITIAIVAVLLMTTGMVRAAETVIASGHPQYPPVMWKEGKNIVGVGPELTRMVFNDLKIQVKSPYMGTWDKVQDQAKQGKIDVLVGLYMTEERKASFEYSRAFVKDPVVIFVAKGKTFPYAKWDDLIGKKGISTTGDSFGHAFDKFIVEKLTVTRLAKVEDIFAKLIDGTADYFIYAKYSGVFESDKLGIADKVEYLPVNASVEDFYLGISKKSSFVKYLPEINKKLEEFVKDGTVDKLVQKYTEIYKKSIAARKQKGAKKDTK
jgi:polar amino acid transport system substrate-binding protein